MKDQDKKKEPRNNWVRLMIRNDKEGRSQLETFVAQRRWYIDTVVQASHTAPFEILYKNDVNRTAVSYIQDEILGLPLIFIRGEQCEEIAKHIRERVDTFPLEEAIQFAKSSTDPEFAVNRSYILAATAPSTFNQEVFDIIVGLMKHEIPDARRGAIITTGYLEWPEFIDTFKPLFDDPDEQVRTSAKSAWEYASKNWK